MTREAEVLAVDVVVNQDTALEVRASLGCDQRVERAPKPLVGAETELEERLWIGRDLFPARGPLSLGRKIGRWLRRGHLLERLEQRVRVIGIRRRPVGSLEKLDREESLRS